MGGAIPTWLYERMVRLAGPVVEAIVLNEGTKGFLSRLSDPFWFQSFGAVIGMDWNSSGVTTSVMRALRDALNPRAHELGLYVCGGKGSQSRLTPKQLVDVGMRTGLDGDRLARTSRLTAKVDNTALQDGFGIYLHSFVVSKEGDWSVVQQGMASSTGRARRYHWHSEGIESFVLDPHAAVTGHNQGQLINLVDASAGETQRAILELAQVRPDELLRDIPRMTLPGYCDIRHTDTDLKRLGAVMALAQEAETSNFEELLLLKGLGPKTLRSLALVSEVVHGTPARFSDPARFAFAHGTKNAKPFPVLTKVYDETITTLEAAVNQSRIGLPDKAKALEKLHGLAKRAEESFTAVPDAEQASAFAKLLDQERREAAGFGGRMVEWQGKSRLKKRSKPKQGDSGQLGLF